MATMLDRIILSNPSLIRLDATRPGTPVRSWVQIAKTGSFVSNRYGTFSITKDDLSTMLHNYNTITPKDPTELPIDYDHLSMDPKKPGDGIAAGWMKKLELREDGDELWCEVEWTPDGAERIKNKEYRFVSPSFVKNHTHKDGTKIGTTLLAAAITNHPFLEGMSALTLYSMTAMGDLAVEDVMSKYPVLHLAEIDQVVAVRPDPTLTPEMTDEERRKTYTVKSVSADGAFVRLVDPETDVEVGWFSTDQLAPARATNPILPDQQPQEDDMQDTKTTESQAAAFAARVAQHFTHTRDWTKAFTLAQGEDESGATCYRMTGISADPEARPEARPVVLSLHRRDGESFMQLVTRVNEERSLHDWKKAYQLVADAHPALAEEYANTAR